MGYLVQKTRVAQLFIGGQNYTSSLVAFQVSDASAFNRGLITTSGTLTLGQRPGGPDIQDYDRNTFKRGTIVTLNMTAGGYAYRHPRGFLYVMSVSYDVESEQLVVELGCRLSLAFLTDDASAILPLVPVPLDPAQQTLQNCSASFASAGKILYQDNFGNLVSRKFFGIDSSAGIARGAWVSVLGASTLAVSPLAGTGAIPDEIKLSYQAPEAVLAGDNTGKIDTVTETSKYFINYPATVWTRVRKPTPTGERQLPDTVAQIPGFPGVTDSCGQALSPPTLGPQIVIPGGTENYLLCSDLWTTNRTNAYLPAVRTETSRTVYGAIGGQVSYQEKVTVGPEIEANPGYFADKYAFCVATYASPCLPAGGCEYYGLDSAILGRQVTTYAYGAGANELIRTVQDTYQTVFSAYNPNEWRAGIQNGVPVGFNGKLKPGPLYRSQRVVTEYYRENNSNVQLTTTYTSVTSRGVGPTSGVSIDALNGIVTSVRRESISTTTLDVKPDSVNTATTRTVEKSTTILLGTDSYTSPPTEAGKYVLEESIPVPLLSEDPLVIAVWVADYSEYLKRFVRGDIYGLQIAESMRTEIVAGWYPGMPFRYADTANNRIVAMRMDACTWGVTQDEAIVVTNGIWNGFSSGTLNLGSNLVGNSRPDMIGSLPAPAPSSQGTTLTAPTTATNTSSPYTGIPVTTSSGSGSGMVVSLSVINNGASPDDYIITIEDPGTGYVQGEVITIDDDTLASLDPSIGTGDLTFLAPNGAPVIDNDVVGEGFGFVVDVNLWLDTSIFTYFEGGITKPNPTDLSGRIEMAIVPYCTGFIVAAGGLLSTDGTGSIPVEYAGTLVTGSATVVNANLFATA